jgi:hypothetical protein
MASFLARKKRCLLPYKHLLFFAIARHKKKFCLRMMKNCQHQQRGEKF